MKREDAVAFCRGLGVDKLISIAGDRLDADWEKNGKMVSDFVNGQIMARRTSDNIVAMLAGMLVTLEKAVPEIREVIDAETMIAIRLLHATTSLRRESVPDTPPPEKDCDCSKCPVSSVCPGNREAVSKGN